MSRKRGAKGGERSTRSKKKERKKKRRGNWEKEETERVEGSKGKLRFCLSCMHVIMSAQLLQCTRGGGGRLQSKAHNRDRGRGQGEGHELMGKGSTDRQTDRQGFRSLSRTPQHTQTHKCREGYQRGRITWLTEHKSTKSRVMSGCKGNVEACHFLCAHLIFTHSSCSFSHTFSRLSLLMLSLSMRAKGRSS